jgi:hypothetical protein
MQQNFMRTLRFLFLECLLSISFSAYSQTPNQPDLYFVTVDPESGCDVINWMAPVTPPDFDEYRIGMVDLPNVNEPPVLTLVGIADKTETQYINCNTSSSSESVGYSVWAFNNGTPSGFDTPDSTILLTADFDSCGATMVLTWGDYNTWRGSITGYNIYRRTGPMAYDLIAQVSETTHTYLLSGIASDQQYQIFVEAVHVDGIRRSTSNMIDINTGTILPTGIVVANYATLGPDNTIDLAFTVVGAPIGESQYSLVRSGNQNGPFTQIATFSTTDSDIRYNDNVSFTAGVNYYRMEGINQCIQSPSLSNMANNIILSGSLTGNAVSLSWNEYLYWLGGVDQYRIIRSNGRNNPLMDTISVNRNTTYTEDLSRLINYPDPVSSLICYQIEATEITNIYGMTGKSMSNRICFSVNPDIRMPNAIIPNDADQTNQQFEPVFSFQPEHYEMIIYNRLGTKIWEGSSPWDGRVNGQFVPEGVYVYYLRVYNYSSDYISLNGKVTVVYR